MQDRNITVGMAVAIVAWLAAVAAICVMWATGDLRAGVTGLALTAVAAVANIRAFLIAQCVSLRNAFDVGRNSVTKLQRSQ